MNEKELRKLYTIFGEVWQYLKAHSSPDSSEIFWRKLQEDGSAIGNKYDFGYEHQLAVDLVVAADRVIRSYYRRDKDIN